MTEELDDALSDLVDSMSATVEASESAKPAAPYVGRAVVTRDAPVAVVRAKHEHAASYALQRKRAQAAVGRAIQRGELARPSTLACRDCGNGATCYDHADYRRRLDVQPVCVKCNARRGRALSSQ